MWNVAICISQKKWCAESFNLRTFRFLLLFIWMRWFDASYHKRPSKYPLPTNRPCQISYSGEEQKITNKRPYRISTLPFLSKMLFLHKSAYLNIQLFQSKLDLLFPQHWCFCEFLNRKVKLKMQVLAFLLFVESLQS